MQAELAREAAVFAQSSGYRYGDRDSFQVPVAVGVDLPGNHDPNLYLDQAGLQSVPDRVLVACPGTAGLVPALLRRGATEVVALEPRHYFAGMTQRVLALVAKGLRSDQVKGKTFRFLPEWPLADGSRDHMGKFILWPEGTEEVTKPVATMEALADLLAPSGKLVVEVWHGTHDYVPQINSWKPKGDAWDQAVRSKLGQGPTSVQAGRRQNMRIYTIEHCPAHALEQAILKESKAAGKPAPKVTKTPPPKPEPVAKPKTPPPALKKGEPITQAAAKADTEILPPPPPPPAKPVNSTKTIKTSKKKK